VDESTARQIADRLHEIDFSISRRPGKNEEGLGFRGFLIDVQTNNGTKRYRVFNGFVRDLTTELVGYDPQIISSSDPACLRN